MKREYGGRDERGRGLLGVEETVIERARFDEDMGLLVTRTRPGREGGARGRCGVVGGALARLDMAPDSIIVLGGRDVSWPAYRLAVLEEYGAGRRVAAALPDQPTGVGHNSARVRLARWFGPAGDPNSTRDLLRHQTPLGTSCS